MTTFIPEEYVEPTLDFLRSRFHPELPHIGTVGTADVDEEVDGDLDDFEEFEEKDVEENADKFSSFRFVPYTASYEMNLEEQEEDLTTKFSFYIRTNDGSWHDLEGEDNPGYQKDDPEGKREDGFWLKKEDLTKSFKKYEVVIETKIATKKHVAKIFVDDKEQDVNDSSHVRIEENENKIKLTLQDKSDPFMIMTGPKEFDIVEQNYKIYFEKSLEVDENGKKKINVKIVNKSPFTEVSKIVQMEPQDNGFESKDDVITRYKDSVFKHSDQEKELYSRWTPILFNKKNAFWKAMGARYGHLLEFSATEEGINSKNDPYESEKEVEQILNLVYDEKLKESNGKKNGKIIFRNHIAFTEKIPPMAFAGKVSEISKEIGISDTLSQMVAKRIPSFYKFQADSIKAISSASKKDTDTAVLVSSRTGGGKTEAFMFPIIDYCISNIENAGTKAIIFYPTKALANDQTSRIISMLYSINQNLKESGRVEKITVGLCHGDIPKSEDSEDWQRYWNGVPLKCPKCEIGYLQAMSHKMVKCQKCSEELDFVFLFQEPCFGALTDILITNPDKIQYDMVWNPDHHGVFGRKIKCCQNCFRGFAGGNRKCWCGHEKFDKKEPLPPKFIVFDEIHQFKGTFGSNVLYIHERLKTIFKRYAKQNFEKNWSVCSIGSSATIANANEFCEKFFGLTKDNIEIVPKNEQIRNSYYDKADGNERKHIFVMPYRYRPAATCAKIAGYLQARRIDGTQPEPFSQKFTNTGDPLQILGFVNNISDVGNLKNIVERERKYSIPVEVGGHSTDYNTEGRGTIEREFNNKKTNVIFSTPTLEVGVDFDTVNSVIIYGFPYSFNDYVQRIGRGGRGESSLVVTICHNFKPIDHYYLSDAKKKISEPQKSIEPIPITRDNPEIIKRQMYSAVYDYISCLDNSPQIWADIKTKMKEEFGNRSDMMYDPDKEYSPINALGLTGNQIQEYQENLEKFVKKEVTRLDKLVQGMPKSEFLYSHKDSPNKKYKIFDIRQTEKQVNVEMIWEVFE